MRRSISMLLASASIAVLSLGAANAADMPLKYVPPAAGVQLVRLLHRCARRRHLGHDRVRDQQHLRSGPLRARRLHASGVVACVQRLHRRRSDRLQLAVGHRRVRRRGRTERDQRQGYRALPRRAVVQDRAELDGNRSRPPRPRRRTHPLLRQGRCRVVPQHLQRQPEPARWPEYRSQRQPLGLAGGRRHRACLRRHRLCR